MFYKRDKITYHKTNTQLRYTGDINNLDICMSKIVDKCFEFECVFWYLTYSIMKVGLKKIKIILFIYQ